MGLQDLLDRARDMASPGDPDDVPDIDLSIPDDASSLADNDLLDADPKPGVSKRKPRVPRAPRPSAVKATAAQKRQVEDSVLMLLQMASFTVTLKDPVCGPALAAASENTAKAVTPIICRNPRLLAWFVGGSGVMDAIALFFALSPFVSTVWGHHVSGSIGHEDGEPVDYSSFSAPSL